MVSFHSQDLCHITYGQGDPVAMLRGEGPEAEWLDTDTPGSPSVPGDLKQVWVRKIHHKNQRQTVWPTSVSYQLSPLSRKCLQTHEANKTVLQIYGIIAKSKPLGVIR